MRGRGARRERAAPGALLERWVPGVRVLRRYERSWLRGDLVAGLVLTALLVPQGMAYAELAGLPSVTGLYTTVMDLFFPTLGTAIDGYLAATGVRWEDPTDRVSG